MHLAPRTHHSKSVHDRFSFYLIIVFVCFFRMLLMLFPSPSFKSQEFGIGSSHRADCGAWFGDAWVGGHGLRGMDRVAACVDCGAGLGGGVRG